MRSVTRRSNGTSSTVRPLLLALFVLGLLLGPATVASAKEGPPEHARGDGDASAEGRRGNDRAAERRSSRAHGDRGGDARDGGDGGEVDDDTDAQDEGPTGDRTESSGATAGSTSTTTAAPGPDRCIEYVFRYLDGHTDAGTHCDRGMNVPGHDGVILHISCSDTFPYREAAGGHVSDGGSDLRGHVIAPEGWWIEKDRGDDCGFPHTTPPSDPEPDPDPDPDPDCDGPLVIEVRDADRGRIVEVAGARSTIAGTERLLDPDGVTAGGTFDCDTVVAGTLTRPPDGYVIVDDDDRTTVTDAGAVLVFTVRQLPEEERPCTGPLTTEVIDRNGDRVAVGGAVATIAGGTTELDADGLTAGGSYLCGTDVAGTLDTPPDGYRIFDGDDETTVTSTGGELVFVVESDAGVGGIVEDCIGGVIVRVVTRDGTLVDGAIVTVRDELEGVPDGELTLPDQECGPVTGTIVRVPPGYALASDETVTVTITHGTTPEIVFVLEPAEVVSAAVTGPEPAPAPRALARTGTGPDRLVRLSAALLLLGLVALGAAPPQRFRSITRPDRWLRT